MRQNKPIIFDLDDTLIASDFIDGKYVNHRPIENEIKEARRLFTEGNIIIIETARPENERALTLQQIIDFTIPCCELRMGKLDGIRIDPDTLKSGRDL
jgi:hypothetical protein